MRWTALLFMVLGSQLLAGFSVEMASSQSPIQLSSNSIGQGEVCLIRIRVEGEKSPVVIWMGKEVSLVANPQNKEWHGYLVADLTAKPGHYKVLVRMPGSGNEKQVKLEISKKNYGVRRLTLPRNMVDLDSKTLQRVKKESKRMKGLWEATPSPPLWSGPFIRPVPGKVVGAFGQRSIINDQPRSPHSGVDLKSERGASVMATNRGEVVLSGDHFFTGLTVVIDHGGGILSMYFHLDRIAVQQGERVKKGHVIGLVGSTGRATGPHLHWGIRINGDRIDPLRLVALSQQLEE